MFRVATSSDERLFSVDNAQDLDEWIDALKNFNVHRRKEEIAEVFCCVVVWVYATLIRLLLGGGLGRSKQEAAPRCGDSCVVPAACASNRVGRVPRRRRLQVARRERRARRDARSTRARASASADARPVAVQRRDCVCVAGFDAARLGDAGQREQRRRRRQRARAARLVLFNWSRAWHYYEWTARRRRVLMNSVHFFQT